MGFDIAPRGFQMARLRTQALQEEPEDFSGIVPLQSKRNGHLRTQPNGRLLTSRIREKRPFARRKLSLKFIRIRPNLKSSRTRSFLSSMK